MQSESAESNGTPLTLLAPPAANTDQLTAEPAKNNYALLNILF